MITAGEQRFMERLPNLLVDLNEGIRKLTKELHELNNNLSAIKDKDNEDKED